MATTMAINEVNCPDCGHPAAEHNHHTGCQARIPGEMSLTFCACALMTSQVERLVEAERLKVENERLRAALEAYADGDNWHIHSNRDKDWWMATGNGWEIAREALDINNEEKSC